jgi:hypothetical protein
MKEHPEDLRWLLELLRSDEIEVNWINHSFYNFYNKKQPLSHNLLLAKGADINSEILKTGISMIGNGIIPSVFFCFPGLISINGVFEKVLDYG